MPPDTVAGRDAAERQSAPDRPAGSLGRLAELAAWVASCQGGHPPRPFGRPRAVVFAGDHGAAAKSEISVLPVAATARLVAGLLDGTAAANVLAETVGATVRVVDVAVDTDAPASPEAGRHKVRRSSGSIDVEDALTADEVDAALAAGRAVADEEVDGGADLLLAGDVGVGNSTPSAVIVAALTGSEPVAVVGRGTGIDDAGWIRKVTVIRDALRRARPHTLDPVGLVRTAGGADLAALAGFLVQAAVRRTPVLLDGLAVGAAATLADELAPGARAWWAAGHRSPEPAHGLVLAKLELAPILDLGMRHGEATGALAALPLLQAATRLVAAS